MARGDGLRYDGAARIPALGNTFLAKFLLLIALVIVVYLLFRGSRRVESQQPAPPQPAPQHSETTGEDMVRCSICGVHLPRSESFISRGRFFCSDEHRRLGLERTSHG